jgi:hypothetical protein
VTLLHAAVLAVGAATSSAPTIAPAPHLAAMHAAAPVVLDGRLDDAAWAEARPSSAFTQKFPHEAEAPTETTTIRVLYDDRAIWIGVDCEQATPLVAPLTRRDRLVETDSVSIALDTRRDGKNAFEFQVSAAGVLADAVRFNDVDWSGDWDENWDARVAKTARGWSAEIWIPLRILRFDGAKEQSWGLQARRYVSARQETDEWAFIPRDVAGEVSRYGVLDGLAWLEPQGGLEVRPFLVAQVQRRDPGSDVAAAGFGATGSVGVDATWHVTPDLTLSGSVRPDFAQVEADQLVLNLSKYETFFPEKRPFFLEGREIFDTPAPILYTRRIGRAPPTPTMRDGEELVDVPTPATIWSATKLVGSLGKGWTIGALTTLTSAARVQVQGRGGVADRYDRLVDPMMLARVLRLKKSFGDFTIGTLLTAATRTEDTNAHPLADDGQHRLCPTGELVDAGARCFRDAYVASFDARWRAGDYAGFAQAAGSLIERGPTRTLADGTTIGSGDRGVGGTAYLGKEGGKHLLWSLAWDGASRRLDFNDLGYMRRQAYHHVAGEISWRTLEAFGPFLETQSFLDLYHRRNLEGANLQSGAYLGLWARTRGFLKLFSGTYVEGTHFDDREIGDGSLLERAGMVGQELSLTTDPREPFVLKVHTDLARLFDGWSLAGDATLTWRPLPQLDVSIAPTAYWGRGEPRYVGTLAGAYQLGELTAKSLGAVMRATYTFTPRLTLQGYAQLFLASGHYGNFTTSQPSAGGPSHVRLDALAAAPPPSGNPDFVDGALNVNLVLRWEFHLGSVLYFVFSRSQAPSVSLDPGEVGSLSFGAVRRAPAVDVALVKLSFWFD